MNFFDIHLFIPCKNYAETTMIDESEMDKRISQALENDKELKELFFKIMTKYSFVDARNVFIDMILKKKINA